MTVINSASLITVIGGSGFVGRHIVRALARRGYRIRVAVRRPDLAGHLQPLGGVGQIHAIQTNLRNPASVARAVQGATAVINLVGILYGSGKQTFDAVHVEGARNVAEAAKETGAEMLLHLSAIGADRASSSRYARSKAIGEEQVLAAFPDAVILRPSVIFGPGDGLFNRFAGLARIAPVLPLIGGGQTRMQPIYVGDVADAAVAAIEGHARPGTIYELGGPQIWTLKDIMKGAVQYSGRERLLVSVPFWVAKLKALFLQLLPHPILTVDQVRLLQSDNVVSEKAAAEGRTLSGLGIPAAHAIESIVPAYLERFRPHGQFSVRRI